MSALSLESTNSIITVHYFYLYRFVTEMPNGAVFIAFSFILRAVEGVGTSMYSTASYALMAQLFSEHKGMIVVSQLIP